MNTQKLKEILTFDEGLRLKPYKCTAGKTSIGVGRNIQDVGISEATAMQMLDEDIARSEKDCLTLFGDKLWGKWSDIRKMGWINFLFQLGLRNAQGFKNTLTAARAEDWATVESNMRKSRWYSQTPKRAERVIGLICSEKINYPLN